MKHTSKLALGLDKITSSVGILEVSSLNHEVLDDPVKNGAFVMKTLSAPKMVNYVFGSKPERQN